jgi:pimeloyl-ACP methyl ester carboxylesterase
VPDFALAPDLRLHYDEQGAGRPVVFLPGWTMSTAFFRHQLPFFAQRHHAIALDYRGHGRSSPTDVGHTLATYARDLRAFLVERDLRGVVLVGWSMGAIVAWEYLRQFGSDRLAEFVNIDQPPVSSRRPDWPYGDELLDSCASLARIQEDHAAVARRLISRMFKEPPSADDTDWMQAEILRVSPPVAGVTLFADLAYDARPLLPQVALPTLVCCGRHSAITPLPTGEYIAQAQPNARLVVFEASGHCPFLEEPARFNAEVEAFIAGL